MDKMFKMKLEKFLSMNKKELNDDTQHSIFCLIRLGSFYSIKFHRQSVDFVANQASKVYRQHFIVIGNVENYEALWNLQCKEVNREHGQYTERER